MPMAPIQGEVPPGVDPTALVLAMPAFQPAPPGADTTMTTDGPDQVWYLVVAITCISIPGLFLIVRIYTKLAVVRMFELADYFIFLAFPLMVLEIVFGYFMVKWGAGVHQWQVTLDQLFKQLYWMNVAEITYCPLSFLVKMAILLQYLRLFAPSRGLNRAMWYGAWATSITTFIFYTVFTFWTAFYCRPRRMIWDKLTPGGKCHDHGPIVISQGAFNMASDVVILLLPTTSLWQLDVPLGRKIIITLLFSTGLLAIAASIMRIVFTMKIAPVFSMSDVSHDGLFIGLWTEAEVTLGFIVACSLSLPRLLRAKAQTLTSALSHLSSRKSQKSTSRASRQVQGELQPTAHEPPLVSGDCVRGERRWERDLYTLPSESGSSEYSQTVASESSRGNESVCVAPLNISRVDVQNAHSRSPSHLHSHSHSYSGSQKQMTMRNMQDEVYVLQQLRFESFRGGGG